eukprot:Skav223853  [mRNA]  locus=scaffold2304:427062:430683:- [translate_table: standard]
MASYSLALQLRAAERTVKAEMPRRALTARLLLACDIVSAVLVIQIGQFTHPVAWLQVVVVTFLRRFVASLRLNWADERTQVRSLDPRAILASLIAPVHYSAFGLVKGQKGAARTAVAMVGVRSVCCILLLAILASRNCTKPVAPWVCRCNNEYGFDKNLRIQTSGWEKDQEDQWYCPTQVQMVQYDQSRYGLNGGVGFVGGDDYELHKDIGPLCDAVEEELIPYKGRTDGNYWAGKMAIPLFDCSLNGLMPAMLEASCEAKEIDIVRFWECYTSWPSLVSGICAGRFTLCAALGGELQLKDLLVLSYVLMPTAALMLSILTHGGGHRMNPPLMDVNADKALRKQIKRQAADLQKQLESGNLQESLLYSRNARVSVSLLFRTSFCKDANCLMSFVRSGLWGFAACQLAIFLICGFFQLRSVCGQASKKAISDSWRVGIPTNALLRMLLEEKTFEAPLSLFVQYFSAFWVMKDDASFASLWVSIFFSTIGISGGFFAATHLSIIDLQDLDDEIDASVTDLTQVIGQANYVHPETHGKSDSPQASGLPPPPGLGPPAHHQPPGLGPPADVQPKGPGGRRRSGQFASATE